MAAVSLSHTSLYVVALSDAVGPRDTRTRQSRKAIASVSCETFGRKSTSFVGPGVSFSDNSHVDFYASVRCGKKEKLKQREGRQQMLERCEALATQMTAIAEPVPEDGVDSAEVGDSNLEMMNMLRQTLKCMEEMKAEMKAMRKKVKGMDSSSSSSSSSSSESSSSDSEVEMLTFQRASRRMQMKKKSHGQRKDEVSNIEGCVQSATLVADPTVEILEKSFQAPPATPTTADLPPSNPPAPTDINPSAQATNPTEAATASVEVCSGGKCKRNGAQEILDALQQRLPASSGVTVSFAKCMGKCRSAANVRVRREDTNPTIAGFLTPEDVPALLQNMLSIGVPAHGPSGAVAFPLPAFVTSQETACSTPRAMNTVAAVATGEIFC
eukprot:TRINITY_DN826_c0_g2_i4.p1 TRINITY_DN826_c0_g2~~TRINITY_DN826_c0_g2_i4.p1  ORF type:complete len:408 (+),score=56.71 TRINITY_DN826_c0_g2_i4:78-1226(+)